jgi:hypothetical protein
MFRVEPNFELGLIVATVQGPVVRVPECQQLIDEVDEAVQLTGIHCVLLRVGSEHPSNEPLTDKLRLANRLANDPTLTQTRLAYVPRAGTEIDPVIETLAKAKGFQGERFEHEDAALEWLIETRCIPTTAGARPDAPRAH